ncbi:MAG: 3-hydroxybenzoate 4-monooxygenase, partial [Brachymonas sp.]|nr:3-hydroxybenzoate 4-monooxygenase [Brachymonas sp.]
QNYFAQHGRYTAGTATRYTPGLLIGGDGHQALATGFKVGTRFHSAPVIRIGDGKLMQLGETLAADERWRLMMFAGSGDDAGSNSPVRLLCDWLTNDAQSPIKRHTPAGADVDALFDYRAVFQQSHHNLPITAMPALLFPRVGKLGLRDYEKAFCALTDAKHDIYEIRGIKRQQGCLVVVRPDQYIAQVLPLAARDELAAFFAAFMLSAY